jgi:uncharacterized protein (DUF885 family)
VSQSHPVFALADRFVDDYAALDPLVATYSGIAGHDDRWGELGVEGIEAKRDLLDATLAAVHALPPAAADVDAALAVRTLTDLLGQELDHIASQDVYRDVTHLASTFPAMRDVLEVQDATSPDGAEAVLARLIGLPDALAGWRERIDHALGLGAVVGRRQVRSVLAQLGHARGLDSAFRGRIERLAVDHPGLADRARATWPAIADALGETTALLETRYLPAADPRDGVGEERYLRAAAPMLGTRLDVDGTLAWAWDRLRTVTDRARRVAARIDPDADLLAVFERLRTERRFAAPSRVAFRAMMIERQATALDHLDGDVVDVSPELHRFEVRFAPPGGALGASYVAPSEDLVRPGALVWSLGEGEQVPLFEEVSTAYHEGFPGHHLQLGTQVLLGDRLSRAHRTLIWPPGYGEGWALYAETLMDELGALEEPMFELGYLSSTLLRLVRVVVDLGLHLDRRIPDDAPFHPGARWTPELATEALQTLAALPADYADSEVSRYLGWPAQAITYAVGERVILDLREERRRRDGTSFDLRSFHGDVLGSGPVGLDHLRELVLDGGQLPDRPLDSMP